MFSSSSNITNTMWRFRRSKSVILTFKFPFYFNRIISNNSSEGDGSEAVRRRRVRRFDRGRLKNRNRVRTAHTLRQD